LALTAFSSRRRNTGYPVRSEGQAILTSIFQVSVDGASTSYIALSPDHTALYGLITAKPRQKVVFREADDVCIDVEFKTIDL
jgi:hypothetical protein